MFGLPWFEFKSLYYSMKQLQKPSGEPCANPASPAGAAFANQWGPLPRRFAKAAPAGLACLISVSTAWFLISCSNSPGLIFLNSVDMKGKRDLFGFFYFFGDLFGFGFGDAFEAG
jgi:hypothetical protein